MHSWDADGVLKLTDRERDVMLLVAEGCSNKEIAGTLIIQEVTVKAHLQSVLRKLGLSNRTQVAVCAARLWPEKLFTEPM
jgi:DNA-binding NarL/FixJ family response regulator